MLINYSFVRNGVLFFIVFVILYAEKLMKEQASLKTDLEMAV